VRRLDSGKDEVIEILRTSSDHPLAPTESIPTLTNYDFCGWGYTADANPENAEEMFIKYDNITNSYIDMNTSLNGYSFEENNTSVLTLYAIFTIHKHRVDFIYPDNTV
jgi:hypothetical protein